MILFLMLKIVRNLDKMNIAIKKIKVIIRLTKFLRLNQYIIEVQLFICTLHETHACLYTRVSTKIDWLVNKITIAFTLNV